MDFLQNNTYDLYKDIQLRTGGEIYLGVVGPVRTGKSTFIKRFMNLLVLPFMEDENEKERAQDEMPQSVGGRTVTWRPVSKNIVDAKRLKAEQPDIYTSYLTQSSYRRLSVA